MSYRNALLAILLIVLTLGACQDRKPPPVVDITLMPTPGVYTYNGQRLNEEALKRELRYLAQENRVEITQGSRVRVRIRAPQGGNNRQVQDIYSYCQSIGLHTVFFEAL